MKEEREDRGTPEIGSGAGGRVYEPLPRTVEDTATQAVDAAYSIHKALGPGLLESVCESCFARELAKRGIEFKKRLELPVVYDGVRMDAGLRLDFLVGDSIVVELKAVEALLPVHMAQLLTYLKLSGKRLGFLINFNVPVIKDGLKRLML
jgi:GxxExxY protein